MVTGAAFQTLAGQARRLYTDFEAVSCYAMRPLLLNGIGSGAADR